MTAVNIITVKIIADTMRVIYIASATSTPVNSKAVNIHSTAAQVRRASRQVVYMRSVRMTQVHPAWISFSSRYIFTLLMSLYDVEWGRVLLFPV